MTDEATGRPELLLDAMGDGVYALDAGGRLVAVNDRFVGLTGYDREELLGVSARFLTSDADIERFERAIRELVDADDPGVRTVESRLRRADGTEVPIEVNLTVVPESGGTMGVVRDISERRARERELERYHRIVEAAGDSIYTLDREGRYTSVNDRLAEWTGYDREDLLGERVSVLMRDEDIERIREAVAETARAGESFVGEFEFPIERAAGDWRRVQGRLSVLRYGGEVQGTVGIVRDVHDHRERERQLRRQNERLDRFAGALSHDLRNPLNVALGRVELAARDCHSDHLDEATTALERMEGLVSGLLTLARQGQPVGEAELVDLATLAERAWQHTTTGDAALDVAATTSLRADPKRLQQLFENLFANSVRHGPGPETDVADLTVRVGVLEGGFYVEDDGAGIDPSVRDRLFEWNVTSDDDGTGFGLAIVQTIVDAHGWDVRATENATGGARFEVTGFGD